MRSIREHTFDTEQQANHTRRSFIRAGITVSIIAFDGSRGLYVFDQYER